MTHIDIAVPLTASALPTVASSTVPTRPETVAEVLDRCRSLDVLAHRVVPGRRTHLDWVVVTRSGVYVVDEYESGMQRPSVRARQGGARTEPDRWTLVIDGQDQPHALSGLRHRAELVRAVLEEAGWSSPQLVVPVLCVDRGGLPPMRRRLRLDTCVVVGSAGLGRMVRSHGELTAEGRSRITGVLLDAFPAAA